MNNNLTTAEALIFGRLNTGEYLVQTENGEQVRANPKFIGTTVKKGTIKKLINEQLIYQSRENENRYLLTDLGRQWRNHK